MPSNCPSVLMANVHRVFVMLENTSGTLQAPLATGYIAPAGRASISQAPSYTDTPELSNTLDTITQARDAMPPGEWSIPMVCRIAASAAAPQGDALFQAAMGTLDTATSGHRKYKLNVCRPTVSIWLQHDDVVQFMSGCVVENVEWALSREGLAVLTFSGRGRKAGIVGVATIDSVSTKTVSLGEGEAQAFSVGGYVTDLTLNNGTSYQITAVNTSTDTITLDSAPTGWVATHTIGPWLPETTTPIGKEIENNSIALTLDGVAGRIRPSTFTAQLPTQFLEEIGDEYPGEAADNKRSVTIDMNVYFRKAEAVRFGQALDGTTLPVVVSASNSNGTFKITMPKVRLSYPTIGEDDAVLTLESSGTALGTSGEDSFEIEVVSA